MKNKILAGFFAVLIFTSAACTTEDITSTTVSEDSSAVQSEAESFASEDGSAREGEAETTVYTQQTSDGTQGAVITFMADGTFEFRPVFYDGSPSVTGIYEIIDNTHVLTAQETTAHNIILEDLGDISFRFDGNNLIYQGTAIGETSDGAVFTP